MLLLYKMASVVEMQVSGDMELRIHEYTETKQVVLVMLASLAFLRMVCPFFICRV